MTRKFFPIFVLSLFLLPLASSAQAQTGTGFVNDDFTSNQNYDSYGSGQGIGNPGLKVAGGWLGTGTFSVDLGCDGTFDVGPIPFTDSHVFGAAGVHMVTNPANPNTGIGTWVKTDNRQISARDVNFGVDATPGGSLLNIAIVSITLDFDHEYETATTTFGARVYLPTQDPLDPTEMPIACSAGQHDTFRRVSGTE